MARTSPAEGSHFALPRRAARQWRAARRGPARRTWRGQGIVEYGLILSLSAVLAVVLLVVFGGTLSGVLKAVGDAIDAAS